MQVAPRGWALSALAGIVAAIPALTAPEQGMQMPTPVLPAQRQIPVGAPSTGTALIVGQVNDGVSGRPVGGAIVTLNLSVSAPSAASATPPGRAQSANGAGAGPPSQPVTTTTVGRVMADGEGRFVFHDLPAGRANLSATAPGYMAGSYGAKRPGDASHPITLTDGERMGDASIRVWKMSTISGTVVDESSDPVVGVSIAAIRLSTVNGARRATGGPSTTTDDRGVYHFMLNPGDYVVAVAATSSTVPLSAIQAFQQALTQPGGGQDLIASLAMSGSPMPTGSGYDVGGMKFEPGGAMGRDVPPLASTGPLLAYRTTYYPEAFTQTQAQLITLAPGDDHPNVDITMRLVPTARVGGTVQGPDGPAGNLALRLVATDSRSAGFNPNDATATTISEASGSFTFLGVPAGQYELQITRVPRPGAQSASAAPSVQTLWARMPVGVESSDLTGLAVVLRPGVRVSGRVEFDGASARPPADRLAAATISLVDLDGQGAPPQPPARVSADGTFTSAGVVPGRYLITMGAPFGTGWTLRSISANGHDLSAAPQVLESDITGALVTFTDHPNEVSGTVEITTPSSLDDGPPVVVFFPANYQAWLANGPAGRQSRMISLSADRHFSVTAIPAGDYLFAAISGDLSNGWQDPKMIEAIAQGATRVLIGDNDHKTVELKPLTLR